MKDSKGYKGWQRNIKDTEKYKGYRVQNQKRDIRNIYRTKEDYGKIKAKMKANS